MKKVYLLNLLFLFSLNLFAQEPFITTWQTTADNDSITIPTTGDGYNYSVYWGDGSSDSGLTGDATHEYDTAGTYEVSISGDFPRIEFVNRKERNQIRSIEQWGDIKWSSMRYAFWDCKSLKYYASDAPDLSNVNSLYQMFWGAESFNGDLGNWNISNIQIMEDMLVNTKMSLENYDKTLLGWASQEGLQTGVELGAHQIIFCEAEEARNTLINVYGWVINGDAKLCKRTEKPFVSKWKISSENDKITLPITGWSDYSVDWGDGTFTENHNGPASHVYSEAGTYTVKVSGIFPVFSFNHYLYNLPQSIRNSLLTIEQWGDMQWFHFDFRQCENLISNAQDVPNLSSASDLSRAFEGAKSFNSNLSKWDVNNIVNLSSMFRYATSFNGNISNWDVSNAKKMGQMFQGAESFNGDISKWDVSRVKVMTNMFWFAISFNGDLSNWNVSNVTEMEYMFNGAHSFNGDISRWDMSSVIDVGGMFRNAYSFNRDISNWDVSNVTDMAYMFTGAYSFNSDLSNWSVSNVEYMRNMLGGSAMSQENYDKTLNAWSSLDALQRDVEFGAEGLAYCEGENGRNKLENEFGWTINDEGKNCRFQRIVFGPLKEKTYGDEDFSVDAYATSGLPINYFSSNEEIASIDGNTVTIVGAGITNISTTQEGNESYDAADTITRELTVLKASQVITFDSIAEKTTDDSGFIPNAEANSGLMVSFTSSNQKVSTIKEDSVIIVGVGKSQITASQTGNENYESADSVSRELLVLEGIITAVRSIENSTVNIFPNPTHDVLHLQKLKTVNKVSIYNAEGKLLEVYRVSSTALKIDLKAQPQGVYFIRLDDQQEVFKILKN